ncbi:MAG: SET domain-containing protein [Pyrinomonadaceae bacterium]
MTKPKSRLAVKRTVTGLGLFTLEPIPANKKIIEFKGPIVPNEEVERSRGKNFFYLNDRQSIDGSLRSNIARYLNHSCKPNAKGFTTGKKVWIWSLRSIKAGEQITIDYGEEYLNAHMKDKDCKCEVCAAKRQPSKRRA